MGSVEANLVIDLSDEENIDKIIEQIKHKLSQATGNDTVVNVQDVDNPTTLNTPARYL